jgi:uncharacterized protein (TIGR02453 family)
MSDFNGFPVEALDFLADLSLNNHRGWFDENRATCDEFVIAPARAFVEAFGERLHERRPDIVADPRVDKSIFRMHRDVRFSKDKSPYKTHLGFFFWEGANKHSPGFYMHLEPDKLIAGGGAYQFDKEQLANFRAKAAEQKAGQELRRAVDGLGESGLEVRGRHYKKVPRGMPADHPNADLLLHNGLWLSAGERALPDTIHSADFIDTLFDTLEPYFPVHAWLVENV